MCKPFGLHKETKRYFQFENKRVILIPESEGNKMNNFIFENSTKVAFGKGCVKEFLGGKVQEYGNNIMLAYGGSSIKKNGIYEEVVNILQENQNRQRLSEMQSEVCAFRSRIHLQCSETADCIGRI